MHNDDDNDDQPTRESILDRYGWAPGEKEQHERELAARAEKIRQEELMALREQRQAAPVVTKDYGAPAAPAADQWDAWRAFILDTVRGKFITEKRLENEILVLGEVIEKTGVEVCTATKAAREAALDPLRAEIAELTARARKPGDEELRGIIRDTQARFHDHPTVEQFAVLRQQLAVLRERIDQLEAIARTAPGQLRVVG